MLRMRTILIAGLAVYGMLGIGTPSMALDDGRASGEITFGDKPLAAGKITFYRDNGQFVGCKVQDGKYLIDHIPIGTHKVTLEGKRVPRQYESDDTTPLVVEVIEGKNVFDLAIE